LDIGKTLEYLETIGVCTFALNSNGSNEFPCFFTSKSGHYAQYNFLNETEAAQLIFTNSRTGLNNGILIGVPIPPEYSANPKLIDDAIQKALSDSKKMNIKGKKVTPYLLEKINQITKGKSVSSNIALIKNNAKTSAKIALELKKLEIKNDSASSDFRVVLNREPNHDKQITVIGGLNLDTYNRLIDEKTIKIKG
jgi:pseudouridine-5'-phosphate glycosidase